MLEQVMIDWLVLLVKCLEQLEVVHCIDHSTCLSDRVHSQHWNTNVDCLHTCSACQNWTDCWSAWAVVSHNEVLNRYLALIRKDSQDWRRHQICDVSLVEVCLYHHALVDLHLVVHLVLVRVIGMNSMGHISRNQEWSLHCLVEVVFGSLFLAKKVVNSSQRLHNNVWASTLGWFWSTFFMVKQGSDVDKATLVFSLCQCNQT